VGFGAVLLHMLLMAGLGHRSMSMIQSQLNDITEVNDVESQSRPTSSQTAAVCRFAW
jgi:hypothetical protein